MTPMATAPVIASIQSAVEACRASVRPQDVVARVGGEEFAIILPGMSPSEGLKAAERMRQGIAAHETSTCGKARFQ